MQEYKIMKYWSDCVWPCGLQALFVDGTELSRTSAP